VVAIAEAATLANRNLSGIQELRWPIALYSGSLQRKANIRYN